MEITYQSITPHSTPHSAPTQLPLNYHSTQFPTQLPLNSHSAPTQLPTQFPTQFPTQLPLNSHSAPTQLPGDSEHTHKDVCKRRKKKSLKTFLFSSYTSFRSFKEVSSATNPGGSHAGNPLQQQMTENLG